MFEIIEVAKKIKMIDMIETGPNAVKTVNIQMTDPHDTRHTIYDTFNMIKIRFIEMIQIGFVTTIEIGLGKTNYMIQIAIVLIEMFETIGMPRNMM